MNVLVSNISGIKMVGNNENGEPNTNCSGLCCFSPYSDEVEEERTSEKYILISEDVRGD